MIRIVPLSPSLTDNAAWRRSIACVLLLLALLCGASCSISAAPVAEEPRPEEPRKFVLELTWHSERSVHEELTQDLKPGERGRLEISVLGLDDLDEEEQIFLVLENKTPTVIQMDHGNAEVLTVGAALVDPEGRFTVTRGLVGTAGGTFTVAFDTSPRPPVPNPRLSVYACCERAMKLQDGGGQDSVSTRWSREIVVLSSEKLILHLASVRHNGSKFLLISRWNGHAYSKIRKKSAGLFSRGGFGKPPSRDD